MGPYVSFCLEISCALLGLPNAQPGEVSSGGATPVPKSLLFREDGHSHQLFPISTYSV